MSVQFDIRNDDMPFEMRSLLDDYPRDSWEAHAGFKDKTRQWLGAHQLFRRQSATVRKDTESYLDGDAGGRDFVRRLVYQVGRLHTAAETIESFLQRHLSVEEELAVPIILHHRLRG